jgi:magnesium transporter
MNTPMTTDTIQDLLEPVVAVFPPAKLVSETVGALRELIQQDFITYCYIVDAKQKLVGVVTMRDLLFAKPQERLEDIMIKDVFSIQASTTVMDAMKEVLSKHYPVYPVINAEQQLVGQIRGSKLFEAQAIEISAQAGSMVGVEKEERLATHWAKSLKYRHPWLQLNLLTAFIAGGVVSAFQNTINHVVILAAFLPVLAGQSGNTGCQALAVTLRGMTLGELQNSSAKKLLMKEAILGLLNGFLVGISAALGMYVLARSQSNPDALVLSIIVLCAMTASCVASGLSGVLVPLTLKKIGADPATASSIFLTTATDVASMGLLLALATWVLM